MIPPAKLQALKQELERLLGPDRVLSDEPLAPRTTFKVGGPADLFVEPRTSDELVQVLEAAVRHAVPTTMLGGGSNVIVADAGVRGLVVHPRGGSIDLEETDDAATPLLVVADAAVTINGLVRWTVGRGLAGLEAWAGTPGTVGGGIYGNAHWSGRLLSELVHSVTLWSPQGGTAAVAVPEMEFGYDRSRLQRTGEVLLRARFVVQPGDPAALRAVARESLAYRKRTQPLHTPSAGCIFQNPQPGDPVPAGLPFSAGALIDRAGLKGLRIGGACVSPVHANFIVNDRGASARDIRALVERCRSQVRERFGVELRDEIVWVGDFESEGESARVHTAD
ncbi:MAG TPA: UDP-N-acetylmuramate dehydrogenase [Vicinamibacterales bacterium]|nr:UDP-N-acetylmuramate dehydrogenase [Vicinamibacterales bacterium]